MNKRCTKYEKYKKSRTHMEAQIYEKSIKNLNHIGKLEAGSQKMDAGGWKTEVGIRKNGDLKPESGILRLQKLENGAGTLVRRSGTGAGGRIPREARGPSGPNPHRASGTPSAC